jgi:hypothetical protein
LGSENDEVSDLMKVFIKFEQFKSVRFAEVFPKGETNPGKIKEGMFRSRVAAVKEK